MPGCWSTLRQPLHLLCWVACATSVAATRERRAVKNVAGASNVTGASGFIAVKASASSTDEDLRSHDKAALQELTSVAQDLEAAKAHDHKELSRIEQQIVSLVHQRDAERKDEKRKAGEIAFLEDEIGRVKRRLTKGGSAAAATAAATSTETVAAAASVSATSSTADSDAASSDAAAGASAGASSDSSELAEAEAAASEADKVIQAVDSGSAAAASSSSSLRGGAAAQAATATAEVAKSAAETAAEEENRRLKAELQAEREKAAAEQRAKEEKARAEAEAARAEAEAREKAKEEAEAQEKAKRDAAEAKERAERDAEYAAEKAKKDKADALADSADDSFKNFMKEEDGEEDQGDPEYEDSANALAGAIGWDRKAVEHNADEGIKQLTEAIGGKQVVKSVQGMLGGIR